MSPIRNATSYLRRTTVTGLIALILASTGAVIAIALVIRGDARGIGEWGVLIGIFISNAGSLLAEHRNHGRATDPEPEDAR